MFMQAAPQEDLPHGICFAALHGAPDGYLRVALAAELMNTAFFIGSVCLNAYLRGLQPLQLSENNCDADPVWFL